jgi:hypothetical protein
METQRCNDVRSDVRVLPAGPDDKIRDVSLIWRADEAGTNDESLVECNYSAFFRKVAERARH